MVHLVNLVLAIFVNLVNLAYWILDILVKLDMFYHTKDKKLFERI